MRLLIAHQSSRERQALAEAVDLLDRPPEIIMSDNGLDTLDLLLQDEPPDVALVDWDLAGVEGPEMCRLVRDFHQGRRTYMVVLATPERSDTTDAWRAGANDCLTTPAPAHAVCACVKKGLDGARPEAARAGGKRGAHAGGAATLDAVLCADSDAGDFFGFGVDLAASQPDAAWAAAARQDDAADAPSGAALLRAVLSER
jgi:DNA-binding response OmpR family regulator